jgi:predicted permease
MDTLWKDLKSAFRAHVQSPGFSVLALLMLAFGIGASTAVFSLVDAILLKPLAFPHTDKLVLPWRIAPAGSGLDSDRVPWGQSDFQLFQRSSKTFGSLGAFKADTFNFTGAGEPERLDGVRASAGFFQTLEVKPERGRTFSAEEDSPGRDGEVVLSHALWLRRFGGREAVLGQSIRLNGSAYTVIGVMGAGFSFPRAEEMPEMLGFHREPEIWVPLAIPPAPQGGQDLAVIGRVKPGVSRAQVAAELELFSHRMESVFPEAKGWFHCRLISLTEQLVGDTRRPLWLMLGAAGIVLLIACSNLANLLLARSLRRMREFTLRAALGAGTGRLVRQLLTESMVLAAAGGAAGMVLAELGIRFVKVFGPASVPRLVEAQMDWRVVCFALGVSVVTGLLFGLAPALSASRTNLAEGLREGVQRAGGSVAGSRSRNLLLVSQVALALVLTVAAGLLVRTYQNLRSAQAGFEAQDVVTFELSLPASRYSDTNSAARLYEQVLTVLAAVPGVRAAGMVSYLPMGGTPDSTQIRIPEHPAASEKDQPFANYSLISSGYFRSVGAVLLRGRNFLDSDKLGSAPVVIVNQAMARRYWPGEDPIGKQVGVASKDWPARTIVGVVADIKHNSLGEKVAAEMFVPFAQNELTMWLTMQSMQFAVHGQPRAGALNGAIRQAIRSIDPELPVAKLSRLTELVDDSLVKSRFTMLLLGLFSGISVLLACVGLYGVISYGVAQRAREIGVRMALGAKRGDVFRMMLSHGGRFAGLGLAAGLIVAFGAMRVMSGFLYGIASGDPVTFAGAAVLLASVATAACVIPARRATRVDPATVLRVR